MDLQALVESVDGMATLYAFDIFPDGSFSEIRLMAVNKKNDYMLHFSPNSPKFYPGIPYRSYWMDLNFEKYVYNCGSRTEPLYSYVNARGAWLKGFYIPIKIPDESEMQNGVRTVYCLYFHLLENSRYMFYGTQLARIQRSAGEDQHKAPRK